MIELTKVSATISAPVETVFKYVTNMENYIDWFPDVVAIRSNSDLPYTTVGKTYVETLLFPEGESQLTIEVVKCEENELFLTQGDLAGFLPQMTIYFSPHKSNQCNLTLQYDGRDPDLVDCTETVSSLRVNLFARAEQGVTNLQTLLGEQVV